MNTQTQADTNKRRKVGFFADAENLAEVIEVTLPKGEMEKLYREYLGTEECEKHGFSGFYNFLEKRKVYHRIVYDSHRPSLDESILMQ